MNPKVDFYFSKDTKWQLEYALLRNLVLASGLKEELKWGCPCYSLNNANVVLIHGFKEYSALLFMKGALLSDPKGILIQQTEHVQAARQIRFKNLAEIKSLQSSIKLYIKEAIKIEKLGLKVELKKPSEFKMAEEFASKLNEFPKLKKAFEALTPGRQRAYLLHFSQAKQSATRLARVNKYIPKILLGLGLSD